MFAPDYRPTLLLLSCVGGATWTRHLCWVSSRSNNSSTHVTTRTCARFLSFFALSLLSFLRAQTRIFHLFSLAGSANIACLNKDRKSRVDDTEMKALLARTRRCCNQQWDGGMEQINVRVLHPRRIHNTLASKRSVFVPVLGQLGGAWVRGCGR